MEAVTQAGYAAARGVSRQRINKLVKEGRIPTVGPRKMIDPAVADQILDYTAIPSGRDLAPTPIDRHPPQGRAPEGISYTKAKTTTEEFKALQAELDYKQRLGDLLPRNLVTDAMAEAGAKIARSLEQLMQSADELTEAAVSGGKTELRAILKRRIHDTRAAIAEVIALPDDEGGTS